jgi:hypothetical protein
MRNHRRGALEWARLIDEWKASGLSLPEFCRTRGLQKTTMCGWVYKPALKRAIEKAQRGDRPQPVDSPKFRKPSPPKSTSAFVPVRLRQLVSSSTIETVQRSAIEVILGAGRRVVVDRGFDAETLRRVVAALESGSC